MKHFTNLKTYGTNAKTETHRIQPLCINQFQQCPSPPGNRGAFAHVVSPGGGAFAILSRLRGLGISVPRGDPKAFDTSVKATTSREKNVRGQINMISVLRIYLLLANHSRARKKKRSRKVLYFVHRKQILIETWNRSYNITQKLLTFVTAVCVLFLIKLRWPKKKNF